MRLDALVDGASALAQAGPKLQKLRRAVQDVEAVFLKDLIGAMRRSVPKSDVGQSFGNGIYTDMFDQAMAQDLSRSGSMGIANVLYRRLSKAVLDQEKALAQLQAHGPETDTKR